MYDERYSGARLRLIRIVQQRWFCAKVDQMNIVTILIYGRPEAAVQSLIFRASVGPDELMNWIQKCVQGVVTG